MSDKIKLANDSLLYVILQRTNYLGKYFNFLPVFLKKKLVVLFGSRVEKKYNSDITNDYASIIEYLPAKIINALDIGCGMAGIDILISKNHGNPTLHLLDKSAIDKKVFYGFEPEGSYYSSLEAAKLFLTENGVAREKIVIHDLRNGKPDFKSDYFDMIISTISWGYHYPVAVYLEKAALSIRKNGVMILDIRKGTGGEKELEKFFSVKPIKDFGKYIRYVCRKK